MAECVLYLKEEKRKRLKDDEGLFDFKHTPMEYDRAMADFVARMKPSRDFNKFEDDVKASAKRSGKW
jgi:hypothetical protein